MSVLVCHNTLLNDSVIANLWQRALQTGLAIRLFRFVQCFVAFNFYTYIFVEERVI